MMHKIFIGLANESFSAIQPADCEASKLSDMNSTQLARKRRESERSRASAEFDTLVHGRQARGQVEILDPRQTGIGQHRLEGFLVGMHAD